MKTSIDTLRALAIATNSLRYNPEIDPLEVAIHENHLFRLRDVLSEELEQGAAPGVFLRNCNGRCLGPGYRCPKLTPHHEADPPGGPLDEQFQYSLLHNLFGALQHMDVSPAAYPPVASLPPTADG